MGKIIAEVKSKDEVAVSLKFSWYQENTPENVMKVKYCPCYFSRRERSSKHVVKFSTPWTNYVDTVAVIFSSASPSKRNCLYGRQRVRE